MKMPEYGTVEFYAEQFADILADIQHDRPDITDNLVEGFRLAIIDWKLYHQDQVKATEHAENKFNEVFN